MTRPHPSHRWNHAGAETRCSGCDCRPTHRGALRPCVYVVAEVVEPDERLSSAAKAALGFYAALGLLVASARVLA